jgi:tetratricopeptide (TPR) repeat protein
MNSRPPSARERIIRWVLTVLTVSLGVGGVAWCTWEYRRPHPSLERAIRLADGGKLDDAIAEVRAYLHANDDDSVAHLLLAQFLVKRPHQPSAPAEGPSGEWEQVALDHLSRVRPKDRKMAVALLLARGRALDRLLRCEEAEAAWNEALEVDPTAPEAGWDLLQLYYLQGREEEGRNLALRLYRVEPDPHDRALLLLELLRPDARPPAPGSIIQLFEPVVRINPKDLHSGMALGLAQTRDAKVEEGTGQLRRVVQTHPDRVEAWDCLLTGLDESGQVDVMEEELGRVPAVISESPRLLKHRARVAHDGSRWRESVDLYRRARTAEPFNRVVEYRLSRALRHVGESAEAERIEQRVRRRDVAIQEMRPLYDLASETPDLGTGPHAKLYQQIADVRERMQLPEEAGAWHRLVLHDDPENEHSLAALKRLEAEPDPR